MGGREQLEQSALVSAVKLLRFQAVCGNTTVLATVSWSIVVLSVGHQAAIVLEAFLTVFIKRVIC